MVICVFGDSITWGAWDLEFGGWVNRLRTYCDNRSREIEIYNNGVDGDYIEDVLNRVEIETEARNPDLIIFAIGINDTPHASNTHGTSLEKFEESYKKLLVKSAKFTNEVIVVGLTNVDENSGDHGYRNDKISKYNEILISIAKLRNLLFVELFGSLENDEFDDGLHPNAKGHKKIYEKVRENLNNFHLT